MSDHYLDPLGMFFAYWNTPQVDCYEPDDVTVWNSYVVYPVGKFIMQEEQDLYEQIS